jgi:putative PIN family toxin of toxin-antitoxin system
MRVVADTNVLVSGSLWSGDSYTLLRKAEAGEFRLLISEDILKELFKVLNYEEIRQKIAKYSLEFNPTIETIISFSEFVIIKNRLDIVKEDPSDNRVLECAQSGGAGLIVTRDKHLLKLGEFDGIKIVDPKQALEEV